MLAFLLPALQLSIAIAFAAAAVLRVNLSRAHRLFLAFGALVMLVAAVINVALPPPELIEARQQRIDLTQTRIDAVGRELSALQARGDRLNEADKQRLPHIAAELDALQIEIANLRKK